MGGVTRALKYLKKGGVTRALKYLKKGGVTRALKYLKKGGVKENIVTITFLIFLKKRIPFFRNGITSCVNNTTV
jgi:hypothetical protein